MLSNPKSLEIYFELLFLCTVKVLSSYLFNFEETYVELNDAVLLFSDDFTSGKTLVTYKTSELR
jgi:hypothetical protein